MKYTKEIIKSQLKEAKKIRKSLPTIPWWRKNKLDTWAGVTTIQDYFGSWNNAMIEVFGDIAYQTPSDKIPVSCNECFMRFHKKPSEIKKSPNHFCSKSCAATHNNKNKTHGTRRSKLEAWLEEKLTDLYPDLEIHFNHKDAIGSELDIYFPTLKLAIELNGIFHYEPIFGESKLEKIQKNDQNKFQSCQSHGISLCIIDTSGQKYFKPKTSQKYLDIIIDILENDPGEYNRTLCL